MGKFKDLLEQISQMKPEDIANAFNKRIELFDFDGITVDEVEVDAEGGITVTFVDADGDEMSVLFSYEEDDGVTATILDGEDDEEFIVIDLDPLAPPVVTQGFMGQKYPKLDELSWMNKSALSSIFVSGDIGNPSDPDLDGHLTQKDIEKRQMPKQFGYFKAVESVDGSVLTEDGDEFEIIERMVTVVRGGKKVRIPVVRKVRRKKLSPKQKIAIRKAVRKRKQKAGKISRKRKRSLALRKRSGLKRNKFNKYQKTQGTANRKR